MPIPVDPITRKKLILVKQLYQQAVTQSQSQHNPVVRILSLISFDLAAETILKVVVAALEPAKMPADGFQALIQQADKLLIDAGLHPIPDKANIQHVHSLRNDAQHKAKYPNEMEVNDCRTYVRDFLYKITLNVWGVSLEGLSLADTVQHEEVKEHLIAAEAALKGGDYIEAVVQAEAGFRTALKLVEAAFIGKTNLSTSALVAVNNFDEEIVDNRAYNSLMRMRKSFLLVTLGLNVAGYWRYDQIALSVINYSTSIADGDTEVVYTGEKVEQQDAEFAVAYAVDAVAQIENLVGDLNAPFGITWIG